MWTRFHDVHSGGGKKEKFARCYIEAPEEEAIVIFYNLFGHSPERVTCTCCGADYSISEGETLEEITAYERGCDWDTKKKGYVEEPSQRLSAFPFTTLTMYRRRKDVMVVPKHKIRKKDRQGEVPEEGYVWV